MCQCHTTCRVPSTCIPTAPRKKRMPKTSIQDLIDMIESKCDKEICQMLSYEIGLLFILLDLEDERIDHLPKPEHPVHHPDAIKPTKGIQLIANMVESLSVHDKTLKGKYPSALLLKSEIRALWECMKNKQQHHKDWKDNFTWRDVSRTDSECLLDGEKDYAPERIKVYIPVSVGSTVFHTVIDAKGKTRRCLFESLVDNNVTEPTHLSVLEGKWINYCDLKDTIDCVLPRKIAKDCKNACDAKNGVIEEKTMCDRMKAVEAYMKAHP